jgi:hypothetical protein
VKNLIEIRHGFDLIIIARDCSLEDKMVLCNAFDGYELCEGVKTFALVDVLGIQGDEFQLRVTLKQPLTYIEIGSYIRGMVNYAKEQIEKDITLKPQNIHWNLSTFGAESDIIDERLLETSPLRGQLLNQMNLNLETEKENKGDAKYTNMDLGRLYLIREPEPVKSYDIFKDLVQHGYKGLCVSRTNPENIRKVHGLKKTPMIWLTQNTSMGKPWILPNELSKLFMLISEFLDQTEDVNSAIIIDGIEYLITQNSFRSMLKLIQSLNDQVMIRSGLCILSINPMALSSSEFALIEKECKKLSS